ncbi:unnamed protein product [Anisakis simplex]|uniref:Uncharacterized protein n=1 Tax=Anisakis simplex TaxID=6269 RepID=A0A0M3JWL5_ANISI|nr:unnamed protein product [Anisakis simplex]
MVDSFGLPPRETLIYECFLLSLGAVSMEYRPSAASVISKAIASLKHHAIVARTIFMQIYYNMIVVYNKKKQITHRLLASNIEVAVASAENRQLLGVIVRSPMRACDDTSGSNLLPTRIEQQRNFRAQRNHRLLEMAAAGETYKRVDLSPVELINSSLERQEAFCGITGFFVFFLSDRVNAEAI